MTLTALTSPHDLAGLFRLLDRSIHGVSFTSSTDNDSWENILAFDPIAQVEIKSVADIERLTPFIDAHADKLVFGQLNYDLGIALHQLSSQHEVSKPLAIFRAYDRFLVERADEVFAFGLSQSEFDALLMPDVADELPAPAINWQAQIELSDYQKGFDAIQQYIRAGDIYQINYTHQLKARVEYQSRDLFYWYITNKPVAHAAYIESDNCDVLSLTPEGFIQLDGQTLTTRPIKGTRPRHSDPDQDIIERDQLLLSEKEQAELFMIVDLLRNDLGKVCETGTVNVVDEKIISALPNVWHTHALIEGQLKQDINFIDALLSMFPGGSITGCPKHRAMEIIDELELQARGLYTGSIGYILPDTMLSEGQGKQAAFNIAIRTLIKSGDALTLGVGGGITIKSECEQEYLETLAKAAFYSGEVNYD